MNDQKWIALALALIAASILFVGLAIRRHTDFLYSQTPEAKAGNALLEEIKHERTTP